MEIHIEQGSGSSFRVRFEGAIHKNGIDFEKIGVISKVKGWLSFEILDVNRFSNWIVHNLKTGEEIISYIYFSSEFNFGNNFKNFEDALIRTSTLTTLFLDITKFSGDFSSLFEGIAKNKSITTLIVGFVRQESESDQKIQEDVKKQLLQALARNESIKELDIRQPEASPDDETSARDFFNFLTRNKVITKLVTPGALTTNHLVSLAEGLKLNTSVTEVWIRGSIRMVGGPPNYAYDLGAFSECLIFNDTLTTINLDAVHSTKEQLKAFFGALSFSSSVTSLSISSIDLTEGTPDPLFHYLRTARRLRKFEIRRDLMCPSSINIDDLLLALDANTSITDLRLGVALSKQIGNLIKNNNKALKSLALYSSFNPEVIETIDHALTLNDTLTSIDINNRGQPVSLNKAIKHNTSLTSLSYAMPLDELLEIISTRTNLKKLRVKPLPTDKWDDEKQRAVKLALENNFSLTHVDIKQNFPNSNEFSQRNKDLMKQRYEDTSIIIHTLIRSASYCHIPIEIWVVVFTHVRYPGLKSFETLVGSIFKLYHMK